MKQWVNHHTHSIFSQLDGHGSSERYALRAQELGQPALSITDHGNLGGIYDHYTACRDHDVKPILGIELYQARKNRADRDEEERAGPAKFEFQQRGPYHLTVLASTLTGYHNLIKLSSNAFLEGYFVKPRADHELLQDHAEGLVFLSGCLGGEVQQALLRGDYDAALNSAATMQEIVGKDNYFIEVMNHGIPEEIAVTKDLIKIAKNIGAKIVPTQDSHYVNEEDHDAHDDMLCQPPGTRILMKDGSTKNIEDVSVDDMVISWDGSERRGTIRKRGNRVTKIDSRAYSEDLVRVTTDTGATSVYTKDHICIARLDAEMTCGNYCVYLMERDGKYRIGLTKYSREARRANTPGVIVRANEQQADRVWVLSTHDSHRDGLLHEELASYKWNIPTLQYCPTVVKGRNTKIPIPVVEFWNRIDSNREQAEKCLSESGLDIMYPFWSKGEIASTRRPREIRACNLLDGMLVCEPELMGRSGLTNDGSDTWRPVTITREKPEVDVVYSIEVENDHTYIADGIVTHNCIGTGSLKASEERFRFAGPEFYLKSYDEMATLFEPEWLENTLHVADMCNVELEFGEFHFPDFPDVPEDRTVETHLTTLVQEGLEMRYGLPIPEQMQTQADYELSVVKEMGFQEYFLVVDDLIETGRERGVNFGPGRGSVAGSIISYALNITGLCPIEYGLIFERFLTPGRVSMPDIDLDMDDRDTMIQIAKEKYGSERVAQISTFAKIKPKSAIRDAARILGFESSVGDRLAKMVPDAVLGVEKNMIEVIATKDMAKEIESSEDSAKILNTALGVEGTNRSMGLHAAGVIIAKSNITDFIPVNVTGKEKDIIATQIDMNWCERLGMLKMDFLGLRNVWVINDCINKVKERHGVEIDKDNLPLKDFDTFKMLQSGNSIGVFQVEGGGMRELMVDMRPDSILDIMALIALYRPGPLGAGMDKTYINRKRGREKVSFPHPKIEGVLTRSLGIMVYQEDVLNVITTLAGWSVAEADDLRKVMGKKLMDKVSQYRPKFVEGCIETSDVPKALAEKIYSDIEYFAGYGFSLAHSASYAMITYATAYLKANYPTEYMGSLLTSVMDDPDKMTFYLNECERMGIEILPPSIIGSESSFSVMDDTRLRFGLGAIRGVGDTLIEKIITSRDTHTFADLHDFFRGIDPQILNSGTIGHLAKSGALDELVGDTGRIRMTSSEKKEIMFDERHSLGVYLTEHPLEGVMYALESQMDTTIAGLSEYYDGAKVKVGGIIASVTKKSVRRGGHMYILRFEDLTGALDVLVFPKMFEQWEGMFEVGDIIVVEGRLGREEKQFDDDSEAEMVSKLFFMNRTIPNLPESSGRPVVLKLDKKPDYDTIIMMDKLIKVNEGDSEIFLEFQEGERTVSIKFTETADYGIKEDLTTMGVI